MHIPDGFLDQYTALATYGVSVGIIGYAIRRGNLSDENRFARAVTISAFIFVAQMIAWPIPGGTSLHLVGGALAGILLGPWLGILAMTIVLIVQCLVFHDGGITALGANLLNMAIVAVLAGYITYRTIVRTLHRISSIRKRFIAGFMAGWISLILAGTMTGLEIGIASIVLRRITYGLAVSLPIMSIWHGILGVIEGSITGSILSYIGFKHPRVIEAEVQKVYE
ncbi:MAG: energy-coupling factor ABC transporter permease [Ignisphaera sp.]|nr:energy-coupling factor ABC transporter permease [Ignisphaera sp.]MCX8168235.1 energy-coupling factor ABC transporter permease [Ignisphaera sp.]MDW8084897.1 energy-coupling factor ABC transporter permease [Ignisphaera sp.]